MGLWGSIKDAFARLGGKEYTEKQILDGIQFGIITKALMPDLSIRDVVKLPKIGLAGLKFVGQHGRPDVNNVGAALIEEGLVPPPPDAPPPPPGI